MNAEQREKMIEAISWAESAECGRLGYAVAEAALDALGMRQVGNLSKNGVLVELAYNGLPDDLPVFTIAAVSSPDTTEGENTE